VDSVKGAANAGADERWSDPLVASTARTCGDPNGDEPPTSANEAAVERSYECSKAVKRRRAHAVERVE
jgi:hypothetical protein